MLTFILKLTLVHLLGDFLFQPNKWVKSKQEFRLKSPYLYFHVLVHAILMLLLLPFSFIYGIAFIAITHFIIDISKIYLYKYVRSNRLFLLDQLAHFLMIALVVNAYFPYKIDFELLNSTEVLFTLIHLLIITSVASVLISLVISKWNLDDIIDPKESLEKAGLYIGILERLFVFGFIANNHWEGIGFLIAAKSVFRFGDLNNAKTKKLTEYVLIGTLLSFGIAILTGLSYIYFKKYI